MLVVSEAMAYAEFYLKGAAFFVYQSNTTEWLPLRIGERIIDTCICWDEL